MLELRQKTLYASVIWTVEAYKFAKIAKMPLRLNILLFFFNRGIKGDVKV